MKEKVKSVLIKEKCKQSILEKKQCPKVNSNDKKKCPAKSIVESAYDYEIKNNLNSMKEKVLLNKF